MAKANLYHPLFDIDGVTRFSVKQGETFDLEVVDLANATQARWFADEDPVLGIKKSLVASPDDKATRRTISALELGDSEIQVQVPGNAQPFKINITVRGEVARNFDVTEGDTRPRT